MSWINYCKERFIMSLKLKSGWIKIISGIVVVLILITIHSILDRRYANEEKSYASIGIENNAIAAVVIVAEQEGFFKKLGLHVKFLVYPTDQLALQALLSYKIDM